MKITFNHIISSLLLIATNAHAIIPISPSTEHQMGNGVVSYGNINNPVKVTIQPSKANGLANLPQTNLANPSTTTPPESTTPSGDVQYGQPNLNDATIQNATNHPTTNHAVTPHVNNTTQKPRGGLLSTSLTFGDDSTPSTYSNKSNSVTYILPSNYKYR